MLNLSSINICIFLSLKFILTIEVRQIPPFYLSTTYYSFSSIQLMQVPLSRTEETYRNFKTFINLKGWAYIPLYAIYFIIQEYGQRNIALRRMTKSISSEFRRNQTSILIRGRENHVSP